MAHLATSAKVNVAKVTEALKVAVVNKQVEAKKIAKNVTIASSSVAALAVTSPAYALVETTFGNEGTGKPFGIDDPLLFWLSIGTFGIVWGFWLQGIGEFGNRDGEESSY